MAFRNAKHLYVPGGKSGCRYDHISRIEAFPSGVGIFNLRDKIAMWVATSSYEQALAVVEMLMPCWESLGRIPPDWTILDTYVAHDENQGDYE